MTRPTFSSLISPQTRKRLSHRVEYAALRTIAAGLNLLGIDRASALMGRLWRLFAPLNARHARADRHLALSFPEMSAEERARILDRMWDNLGRTAAETILLPRLIAEPERIVCDVPAAELEKARTGAIFVSLHTGNWEIVSIPLRDAGLDLKAVYKPLTNPYVEEWLARLRRSLYAAGLTRLDRGIALKLRSFARSGATLAIIADHRDDTHIEIDFFGRPSGAMPFPAMLARRLGLPIFVGRSIRTEGAHFRVDGHWLEVPVTADPEADTRALTITIHAVFEGWIREHPEQWMWAHRKWL
jgi:Kdo2-lipid IVA lauroyltransferase/acyltransferase